MASRYDSDTEARRALTAGLKALPSAWLDCRDPGIRHEWKVSINFHVTPEKIKGRKINVIARHLICKRCSTAKHEDFMPTKNEGLVKIATRYYYPENYAMPGVPRGLKPARLIWQESYLRALESALPGAKESMTGAEAK